MKIASYIKKSTRLLKSDFLKNKFPYTLLFLLLTIAFVLRVWRIDQLLGFYFDQGRDALVINGILHGDLVLIGPTTGIAGLFRGPLYYYFLIPGYLFGGNPVAASIWQSIFIILGFVTVFFIIRFYFSIQAGLITLFLMTFSFNEIQANRWLSNPTPATFFSPLALLFLALSFKSPKIFLPLSALVLGILLQLETASSFFLVALTIVLLIVYRKKFHVRPIILSTLFLGLTLLPQVLFDLRHHFLQTQNFLNFLTNNTYGDKQPIFQIPSQPVLQDRINLFATIFFEKLKINFDSKYSFLFTFFLMISIYISYKYWTKPLIKVMAFWFYGVLLLLLFYQGNYGRIYNYYLTALIPLFFIYLAVLINHFWRFSLFKPSLIILLGLFLFEQGQLDRNYLTSGVDGSTTVAFGNQVQAVEYVLKDANSDPFNTDVYVPPVIPYTYTYLFDYLGKRLNKKPVDKLVSNLYTIHEVDLEMPSREKQWLTRQEGIGQITKQIKFGGITVEKRIRITK